MMRAALNFKICCSVSLVLTLIGQAVVFAEKVEPDTHKWTILIGVDDYIDATDLKYCGADQLALQKHLVASGFPQDQVFVLHDNATDKRYQPFKSNIDKQLEIILGLVQEDDVLVLAFSGHRVHLDTTSYLCSTDADLGDPDSLISLSHVYDQL
ncbi:MAG: hypothetical protein COA78_29645 [Blastopirellula sp.]|nr:MAG: hypothetical protein COA78_29645 [Blastopirellula sp.]